MITSDEFVRQSLDLNLFFARIMKEHALFLETSFMMKDYNFINQADYVRRAFDSLLSYTVQLSNGTAGAEVLNSGEIITPYTMNAESVTSYLTGIQIPTDITQAEAGLSPAALPVSPELEQAVLTLNNTIIEYLNMLISFKTSVLEAVNSCKLATSNYPLMLDHILREAKLYLHLIQKLQNREKVDMLQEVFEQESFWDDIMGEHAKFIRGMLDPTQEELIAAANNFSNEFEELESQTMQAKNNLEAIKRMTDINMIATKQLRDFKLSGTQGILGCKIKSVILPLLSDHVLREANHYLRLLGEYVKTL